MQAVFILAYIGIGLLQVSAGMDGVRLYWGVGAFASLVLFVLCYAVPVVGSLLSAAAVYYGARYGWHWEWWQALALAVPGIILWLFIMTMGGLATVLERRTS